MDELKAKIGISHKFYVIVIIKEKDVNHIHNGGREWATLIKTINAIRQAIKSFFVVKGACILENHRDLVIKSGCTLACTKNGWFNNDMAFKYIQHFAKYNRPTGIYTLLILDGHGSHAIFRFKQIAYKNNIIFLYLPPHTTHNL
jgi:hypothetical protein